MEGRFNLKRWLESRKQFHLSKTWPPHLHTGVQRDFKRDNKQNSIFPEHNKCQHDVVSLGFFFIFFSSFRDVCYELWSLQWSQVFTGLQLDLCLVSISSLPAANCSCLSAFVRTNHPTIPDHLAVDYILRPQICSVNPLHFQYTSCGGGHPCFTHTFWSK